MQSIQSLQSAKFKIHNNLRAGSATEVLSIDKCFTEPTHQNELFQKKKEKKGQKK